MEARKRERGDQSRCGQNHRTLANRIDGKEVVRRRSGMLIVLRRLMAR
jgi:hypothetical protein